jgi:RNA-directed DNA polymerase
MTIHFTDPAFVDRLAANLLSGLWSTDSMVVQAGFAFADDKTLIAKVVPLVRDHFSAGRPKHKVLAKFLLKVISKIPHEPDVRERPLDAPTMTARWPVPMLRTTGALAEWLKIPVGQLDWLADVKGLTLKQSEPKLRHYVNVWIARPHRKPRLLEVPKPRLKAIQRRILHEILDKIPPHDAAHGFRVGRSIVSYVKPHVGQRIVLRFDLRDFFASVSRAQVEATFRKAGYPRAVAKLLTGLCTTRTPQEVNRDNRFAARHLPQGAPTSPALANLAAYRLDVRLTALAQKLGATYTRYADDLAFSGDQRLARTAKRVQILVGVIAAEEGFELNFRKSRFMRQSVRQQLAGVVVNARPNLKREDYDQLKAILHNCIRHGPASQNRAGHADFRRHLQGRIAHVRSLHAERGAKLQAMFERIDWTPNHEAGAAG